MKEIEENFSYFTEHHPDIYAAYETYGKKIHQEGYSREEIEHTILLVAPTGGFPRMMEGIMLLRQELA